MKRAIPLFISVMLLAATASCRADTLPPGAAGSTASAAASASSASPSSKPLDTIPYIDLGFEVPYEAIPPVSPSKAGELRIALPADMASPRVVAMPDGGALALGQRGEDGEWRNPPSAILAARFGADGRTLWTKTYGELPDAHLGSVQKLGEDGFAFTCSVPEKNHTWQYAVFCAGDGHITYQEFNEQTFLYQHILRTDAGIVAVGDGLYRDGKLTDDTGRGNLDEELSILAQGEVSSEFFSRQARAEGYFSPSEALWTEEAGLVILAYKKANAGSKPEILAYDTQTLERKWNFGRDGERSYLSGFTATVGGLLVNGFAAGKPFILKLDNNGKQLWEIAPDEGKVSVTAIAAFPDGGFAAAIHRYKEDDPGRGAYLARFGPGGAVLKKIELPREIIQTIRPTGGGGLLTVGTQNIKTLPQPALLSSIWYDSETIVTKYDGDLHIQWRKVYDKYKDSIRQDIAVPAADGRIIVEK